MIVSRKESPGERFYVRPEDVHGGMLELAGEEAKHARSVLRRKIGDVLIAVDGRGAEYHGVIEGFRNRQAQVTITRTLRQQGEPCLEILLLQAVARDQRFRLIVEKAVELGVHAIQPITTERTQPGDWDKRASRWQQVAIAAMKQSGRCRLPEVHPCLSFQDAVEETGARPRFIAHPAWASGGLAPSLAKAAGNLERTKSVAVAIGPEGGFSDGELDLAVAAGFQPVNLGTRRLRSETAGIVALTLLMHLAGEM